MIYMQSKYDKMHKNGIFYALTWINNHIISRVNFMLSIVPPLGENVKFIDTSFINSLPNFHGLTSKNTYMYLEELDGKCYLYNIPGVPDEALKMQIFPQTLRNKAKDWFRNSRMKFLSSNEKEECFHKKISSSGKPKPLGNLFKILGKGKSHFVKHGNDLKI